MLKRKAYDYLNKWRSTKDKECLLIKGARQVGKTYLVREFGKNEYKSFIEINFIEHPEYKSIFDNSLNANDIYERISLYIPNANLISNNTLIFFDEIQKCPKARTALKFLAIDNKYDVIASGSLLGIHYNNTDESNSIPVGYESQYIMYSLDFEEFLWANGLGDKNIENIKKYFLDKKKVPDDINNLFEKYFREYIVVGGMPEVVDAFVKKKNYSIVKQKQSKILSSYDDDIANYAKNVDIAKIRKVYKSLPIQLAKENKLFSYSLVEKGSGSKKYISSITWLLDSNLIYSCNNVSEPNIPLLANSYEKSFKLYINDTGLLMSMYGDEAKRNVIENTMKGNAKGGIYENAIAELLVKKGYKIYCYKKTDNTREIEFLIEKGGEVLPIEVKAGNTSTISLNSYIEEHNPSLAYKLINGNIGKDGVKYSLPHYMIMFF